MQLRWSAAAVDDLERICFWIEKDNPEAAWRVANTIYVGCGRLREFPTSGRSSRHIKGWRELAFPPLPYIAVYRVKQSVIEISRIYHGAQDWP